MKKMYVVPVVGVVFVGMTNALLAGSDVNGGVGPGTGHDHNYSKLDEFDEWESCDDDEDVGA